MLRRGGRRYRLGPENELVLELEGVNRDKISSAPLEQYRKKGDLIVLPDGSEVHPDHLRTTRLVVHGEPLVRLEPYGDSPISRDPLMVGFQLGGSAWFQFLARMHVVGPLYAEAGLFVWGPPPLANGSTGVVVDIPIVGNLSTYAGGGVGFGWTVGEGVRSDCDEEVEGDCTGAESAYAGFWHGRIGLGYRFPDRNLRIGLDGGFWYGLEGDDGDLDGTAGSDRFLIPMGGLVFLHEL